MRLYNAMRTINFEIENLCHTFKLQKKKKIRRKKSKQNNTHQKLSLQPAAAAATAKTDRTKVKPRKNLPHFRTKSLDKCNTQNETELKSNAIMCAHQTTIFVAFAVSDV